MTEEIVEIVTLPNKEQMIKIKGMTHYFSIPRFIELLNKQAKEIGISPEFIKDGIMLDICDIKLKNGEEYPLEVSSWEIQEYCTGKPNYFMRKETNQSGVI